MQGTQRIQGRTAHHDRIRSAAIDISHRQSGAATVEPDRKQPLLRNLVDDLLARTQRQADGLAHLNELSGGLWPRLGRQRRGWTGWLRDGETPVDAQVLERLDDPAGHVTVRRLMRVSLPRPK